MKRLVITLLLGLSLHAQSFEITSVKPHGPIIRGTRSTPPACQGGRFVAVGPLSAVIVWAYGVDTLQVIEFVSKLPDWAQLPSWYDLQATTIGEVSDEGCRKMTQSLLVDRLHFASHWEVKSGKIYNLVVVPNGPKMPLVKEGDESVGFIIAVNGKPAQPAGKVNGLTMDDFAKFLAKSLVPLTPVINKTGLQGLYKITLTFSDEVTATKAFADPDQFTAVQQQLGLKLEEGKGPVSHFIVDHIEKPDEN